MSAYETLFLFNIRYEFRRVPKLYTYLIPMLGWRYSYDTRVQIEPIEYEFFRTGLSLGLDYNLVDWIGFYRRGWALGIVNTTWGSHDGNNGQLKSILTSRFAGYGIIGGVNPNARIAGTMSFNHEMTGLGSYLRGVRDDGVYGDRAVFLNTGVQIKLWEGRLIEPPINAIHQSTRLRAFLFRTIIMCEQYPTLSSRNRLLLARVVLQCGQKGRKQAARGYGV